MRPYFGKQRYRSSPGFTGKAEAKLEDIPVGARLSDLEISTLTAAENSASLTVCSMMMGKSIREDIAALYAKYHATRMSIGLKILEMNKDKGWLVPPPLHVNRPELVEA